MRPSDIYKVCALLFAVMGFVTFLNLAAVWHLEERVSWMSLGYALMDFLVAYGFFTRERWILPTLGLNFLGSLIGALILLGRFGGDAEMTRIFAAVVLSGGLLFFVYKTRAVLRRGVWEYALGGAFIILWILQFGQRGIF